MLPLNLLGQRYTHTGTRLRVCPAAKIVTRAVQHQFLFHRCLSCCVCCFFFFFVFFFIMLHRALLSKSAYRCGFCGRSTTRLVICTRFLSCVCRRRRCRCLFFEAHTPRTSAQIPCVTPSRVTFCNTCAWISQHLQAHDRAMESNTHKKRILVSASQSTIAASHADFVCGSTAAKQKVVESFGKLYAYGLDLKLVMVRSTPSGRRRRESHMGKLRTANFA